MIGSKQYFLFLYSSLRHQLIDTFLLLLGVSRRCQLIFIICLFALDSFPFHFACVARLLSFWNWFPWNSFCVQCLSRSVDGFCKILFKQTDRRRFVNIPLFWFPFWLNSGCLHWNEYSWKREKKRYSEQQQRNQTKCSLTIEFHSVLARELIVGNS